jgi:hypothetical protein
MMLIVLGIAVIVLAVVFAAVHARNAPGRQNRFAASGELGAMPWIHAGSESSDCDAGTTGDASCGDGGGGGGGGGD